MRAWLEQNKVYFETVAATLLSAMAVLIMKQQTAMVSLQTEYARIALMPSFVISTRLSKYPPDGNFFNKDTLSVENNGAEIHEFRAKAVVYLRAKVTDQAQYSVTPLTFAVNGYYPENIVYGLGTGHLMDFTGPNNNQIFVNLYHACTVLARERHLFIDLSLDRYISLSYKDRLGIQHMEYYSVQPFYGASRITAIKGSAVIDEVSKAFGTDRFIDIDQITPQELMEQIEDKLRLEHKGMECADVVSNALPRNRLSSYSSRRDE